MTIHVKITNTDNREDAIVRVGFNDSAREVDLKGGEEYTATIYAEREIKITEIQNGPKIEKSNK